MPPRGYQYPPIRSHRGSSRFISRRPIEPRLDSELLADLGFDSLQVLELVGELEEHFDIAVPLNDLSRIRTVSQVVAEVRALTAARGASA